MFFEEIAAADVSWHGPAASHNLQQVPLHDAQVLGKCVFECVTPRS